MQNVKYDSCHGKLSKKILTNCPNKPKTAADNILITRALEKSHFGYNYWLGMHYDTIKPGGWFWDDFTPVEGPHAFTNFMPGQTRGTTIYLNNCATLLTNLTDSSGFGDLGKWRMEQCSRDGINGLCSSSPGIDLALLYKCVDCLKTGKPNISASECEKYDIKIKHRRESFTTRKSKATVCLISRHRWLEFPWLEYSSLLR